jgi:hypothetical protein
MMKKRKTKNERERVYNDAIKVYEHIIPMVSACNMNMEYWWNNDRGKPKYSDKTPSR